MADEKKIRHLISYADEDVDRKFKYERRFWSHTFLTWLANEEAHVVSEDGGVAIQEVAGQFHHDGQLS